MNHNIKLETGQPLDFETHRYLLDIYLDNSKYLACLKAGQIGFSKMAILKTLWMANYQHIEIGYILPTVEMVQKFVGSKVNRLAQQNPVIANWMKDKDSITQKQIGESYIYYLGAMTDRSAIMISLDMIVADEYDKAPQEILEIYDSRLQHSKYGYKWVFSNPTIPEFGVDNFWRISDKKKWHVTHLCGKKFVFDEGCIDYEVEMYKCPFCHGELTYEERRMGEWIATA
jgi:phage terminase large subunit GpA-like protein